MRRNIFLILVSLIVMAGFAIHGEDDSVLAGNEEPEENLAVAEVEKRIESVGVSHVDKITLTHIASKRMLTFGEEEDLKLLFYLVEKSRQEPGIVNIVNPNYVMEVHFADGTTGSFNVWINEKGERSALVNQEETHTLYTVPEVITEKIRDLVDAS